LRALPFFNGTELPRRGTSHPVGEDVPTKFQLWDKEVALGNVSHQRFLG
jgi:hypothetical protein